MSPLYREAEGGGVGSEGTFGSLPPGTALVMVRKEQNPERLFQQSLCEPRRLLQPWDGVFGGCADGLALVQSRKQGWLLAKGQAGHPNLGSQQAQL